MTFIEHLAELRDRLLWAGGALIVGFIICYIFSNQIFDILRKPLEPVKELTRQSQLPLALVNTIVEPTPLAIIRNTESGESKTYREGQEIVPGVTLEAVSDDTVVLRNKDDFESIGKAGQAGGADKSGLGLWTILSPLEWVFIKLKIAGYGGVILALPILLYQACGFIFPGLTTREKRAVKILIGGCSVLVVAGFSVAYFAIFPLVLPYLLNWVPEGMTIQLRANETLSILIKGLLAFSIAFQFPMVVIVLVWMDILSPQTLRDYRKVAVVGLAVASAFFTPPDPISMLIMLVPLYLLYELSILVAIVIVRRRAREAVA